MLRVEFRKIDTSKKKWKGELQASSMCPVQQGIDPCSGPGMSGRWAYSAEYHRKLLPENHSGEVEDMEMSHFFRG